MPTKRLLALAAAVSVAMVGGSLAAGKATAPDRQLTAALTTSSAPQSPTQNADPSADPDSGSHDLLPSALPSAGSATGSIVAGFPSRLLPLVPGSNGIVSSVSPGDGRLQAAVVATLHRPARSVLGFYRQHLVRWGFIEVPSQTAGSTSAAAFRRGASSVVVTATAGGKTQYSVYAILAASKSSTE